MFCGQTPRAAGGAPAAEGLRGAQVEAAKEGKEVESAGAKRKEADEAPMDEEEAGGEAEEEAAGGRRDKELETAFERFVREELRRSGEGGMEEWTNQEMFEKL